ncbi:BlaR1 family beta-lactam sensor/signal transducer [Halalkalibacter okhensis]|uniref:Regulatory protein n=1 Tax=Halalkalibacter okhensis TaxID=333138 RepID=A0A0B0IGA5_9BACI|nr:BlaR1 family beta-lactam sensor/signal transducer [Halalkalibacter okhensis]KHF41638.1 regulatory protein [Halalkalibacter okhensis]
MGDSFFSHFLISNLYLAILLGTILLLKKLIKSQITVNAHYYISVLALFTLITPFVPYHLLKVNSLMGWITDFRATSLILPDFTFLSSSSENQIQRTNWLQDFSMTVEQSWFDKVDSTLFALWVMGICILFLVILFSNLLIWKIKRSLQVVQDHELLMLLTQCKEEFGFYKRISFGYSSLVKSPITFGLFRPFIVLPKDMSMLSIDEMRCVFLHEVYHCKRKDVLINYAVALAKMMYWFNPVVWYFLRGLKTEMEISCDYEVLKSLNPDSHLQYGKVILKFASVQSPSMLVASEMSSSFKQVKKRIVTIANYQVETKSLKTKSMLVISGVLALLVTSSPSFSALAVNHDHHSITNMNIAEEDYSRFFEEFSGTAVLYDAKEDQYRIYNQEESMTRYIPASTYKIYNSLFALQSGIISQGNSDLPWDGTIYQYEEWNQDQDLLSAMKSSASWYFHELDQQIGAEMLRDYYQHIQYGNTQVKDVSSYWLDGTLKISPVEQVNVLKDFYYNEFMFEPVNIQTIKDSLFLEEAGGNRLFGKTGTVVIDGEHIGWFVGYLEAADHTTFFAVYIEGDKQASGSSAAEVALSILEEEGLYVSQ